MSYKRAKEALEAMRSLVDGGDDDDLQVASDWALIYMAEDRASAHGHSYRLEYEARQGTVTMNNGGSPALDAVS